MQFFTKQRIEKQLQNWKILPLEFLIELSLTDRKLGLVEKKKLKNPASNCLYAYHYKDSKDYVFCAEFPREDSVEELKENSYD